MGGTGLPRNRRRAGTLAAAAIIAALAVGCGGGSTSTSTTSAGGGREGGTASAVAAPAAQSSTGALRGDDRRLSDGDRALIEIGGATADAEVAASPASQARGLGGTEPLQGSEGLYFPLPPPARVRTFWMKDVSYPIDIVWIRGRRVIGVTADIPAAPPGALPADLPVYSSPGRADSVLEMRAGWSREEGVREGNAVSVSRR